MSSIAPTSYLLLPTTPTHRRTQAASDKAWGTGGLGGRECRSGLCDTDDSGEDDSTS